MHGRRAEAEHTDLGAHPHVVLGIFEETEDGPTGQSGCFRRGTHDAIPPDECSLADGANPEDSLLVRFLRRTVQWFVGFAHAADSAANPADTLEFAAAGQHALQSRDGANPDGAITSLQDGLDQPLAVFALEVKI